jgi:hypothetical protein
MKVASIVGVRSSFNLLLNSSCTSVFLMPMMISLPFSLFQMSSRFQVWYWRQKHVKICANCLCSHYVLILYLASSDVKNCLLPYSMHAACCCNNWNHV